LASANSITPFGDGVIANAPEIKVTYQINTDCELMYKWNDYTSAHTSSVCGVIYVTY
jgi:hypothetical protein